MLVVATAGHVDHGKSTLVRALTAIEPDRWAEERRRGMTIDLGFAWTDDVTLVDVPGHERFLANMLAGLGPVTAVMVVVAADAGWCAQTEEHVRAVELLGIKHVLPVVTRADLADPAAAAEAVRSRLGADPVVVSAVTGSGLDELRERLAALAATAGPAPDLGRPRLWVDRSFSLSGAGTVVTGTLTGGSLRPGDDVLVADRRAVVRGIQSCGGAVPVGEPGTRVAVSLRGVDRGDVRRGDALVRPGMWHHVDVVDVAVGPLGGEATTHRDLVLHVGSAAPAVRLRPLGGPFARLTLQKGALPLQLGDRGVLRDPGGAGLVCGVEVVDLHPPPLRRRGAAAARADELASTTVLGRLGFAEPAYLVAAGAPPEDAVSAGRWLVHPSRWARLRDDLVELARTEDGISTAAAAERLGLPAADLVTALAASAGIATSRGRLTAAGTPPSPEVAALLEALDRHPFDPGPAELSADAAATAERHGLLLRLGPVCLRPDALDVATAALRVLPQPFTVGDVRDALVTTRRIAIPLLEALDAARVTERLPDGRRVVRVGGQAE